MQLLSSLPRDLPCSQELPSLLLHFKENKLYAAARHCDIGEGCAPGLLFTPLEHGDAPVWALPPADLSLLVASPRPRWRLIQRPGPAALKEALGPEVLAGNVLTKVLKEYQAPRRVFHSEWHLYDLFDTARQRGIELSPEQSLAILFHDVVYVPGAANGYNEEMSVAFMEELLKKGSLRDCWDWSLVASIIRDTIGHQPSSPQSKVVLALDLSSIAAPAFAFEVYNELVWLENKHLISGENPRKTFNRLRLSFLQELLQAEVVFPAGFEDWEHQARENLAQLKLHFN